MLRRAASPGGRVVGEWEASQPVQQGCPLLLLQVLPLLAYSYRRVICVLELVIGSTTVLWFARYCLGLNDKALTTAV